MDSQMMSLQCYLFSTEMLKSPLPNTNHMSKQPNDLITRVNVTYLENRKHSQSTNYMTLLYKGQTGKPIFQSRISDSQSLLGMILHRSKLWLQEFTVVTIVFHTYYSQDSTTEERPWHRFTCSALRLKFLILIQHVTHRRAENSII